MYLNSISKYTHNCPNCGSGTIVEGVGGLCLGSEHDDSGYFVRCTYCDEQGEIDKNVNVATKQWNDYVISEFHKIKIDESEFVGCDTQLITKQDKILFNELVKQNNLTGTYTFLKYISFRDQLFTLCIDEGNEKNNRNQFPCLVIIQNNKYPLFFVTLDDLTINLDIDKFAKSPLYKLSYDVYQNFVSSGGFIESAYHSISEQIRRKFENRSK